MLTDITHQMVKGERIKAESQDEKDCFQLIHDQDRIGGHVKGSITSKNICEMRSGLQLHFKEHQVGTLHYHMLITSTPSLYIMLITKKSLSQFYKESLKKRA